MFVAALLVIRARRKGIRATYRPVLDLALGSVAGIGLAAPLPSACRSSVGRVHSGDGRHTAFPPFDILHTIFRSYDGLALAGGLSFGPPGLAYVPTAAYIGAIAIVLVVLGVVYGRRRPSVVAFVAVAVVTGCFVFLSPLVSLLLKLPAPRRGPLGPFHPGHGVRPGHPGRGGDGRARPLTGQPLRTQLTGGGGFAFLAVVLAGLWVSDHGGLLPAEVTVREKSFIFRPPKWASVSSCSGSWR